MSQPRVVTLCIMVGMSALVANSTAAYATGLKPAIFDGPVYVVLLVAWLVCVGAWVVAEREHRRSLRQREEDYRLALTISNWQLADSGSRKRDY
jgi:hypothetical protein